MKRILSLFLSAVLLASFTGCNENTEIKPVDSMKFDSPILGVKTAEVRKEYRRDDNGKLFYYCTYPEITLSDEDAEKYPELSEALEALVKEKKEVLSTSEEEMTEFAEEMTESFPDYDMELYDTTSARVRRADDVVLSLQLFYDGYSGGAHGYYAYDGYTFDTKTGKLLSYTDVITDKEKFLNAVADKLDERRDELYLYEDTNFRELIDSENMFSWTLENNSITVSFAPYNIAPFAAGAPTVTISDIEYPGLIKDEYISDLDFFATEIYGDAFAYDVTGDGIPDRISAYVWSDHDYETGKGQIYVSVNGNEYRKEVGYIEEGDMVFVKTPEGKCYILASLRHKNSEENNILCFELGENPGEPKKAEGLSFHYEYIGDEKTGYFRKWAVTNPESFFLEDTEGGFDEFRVGEEGLPERVN